MAKPVLVVGNKNYSSWSLRPYMALAMAGVPFELKMIRFGEPRFGREIRKISSAGLVPVLLHKGQAIWDSLAIIEYAAETWPSKGIWPKSAKARALARSAAAEIHSGFRGLRDACPMNLRRPHRPLKAGTPQSALKDVARLEQLWSDCRKAHGRGGPFLFGAFSAADAMYAPVVTRLETYAIPVGKETKAYMDAVLGTEAFKAWKADGLKEPWIVPEDEAD